MTLAQSEYIRLDLLPAHVTLKTLLQALAFRVRDPKEGLPGHYVCAHLVTFDDTGRPKNFAEIGLDEKILTGSYVRIYDFYAD
jgi:hypothetical protein